MADLSHRYLEQGSRNAGLQYRPLGHVRSHQFSVRGQIEQFLAIPTPVRLAATITGDQRLAAAVRGRRKRLNIDFGPTGLVRRISDPACIGRESALSLAEIRIC